MHASSSHRLHDSGAVDSVAQARQSPTRSSVELGHNDNGGTIENDDAAKFSANYYKL